MRRAARDRVAIPIAIVSFTIGVLMTTAIFLLREGLLASLRQEVISPAGIAVAPPLERATAPTPVEARIAEQPDDHGEAVPAATISAVTDAGTIAVLRKRDLKIPVDGIDRKDLRNTFAEARGSHTHEALDIMAPRNTRVRAVDDGRIQKLFTSKAGGITIYEFDPTETFAYYYAHLDRYADGLREGQSVQRGDVIGYVGSTGNASPNAPHLHFTIFRLTPERKWWKGEAIDPYPILKGK